MKKPTMMVEGPESDPLDREQVPAAAVLKPLRRVPRPLQALILWLLLAAVAYVEFGIRPRSIAGWLAFVLLGPLAFVAVSGFGEAIQDGISHIPYVRWMRAKVERATEGEGISFVRIVYYLAEALMAIALIWGAWWLATELWSRLRGIL